MITMGIAVLAGIMYATGNYSSAFWLIVLAIISGAGAAVKAIANPDWYANQRIKAGLEIDLFNPRKGVVSLIVTKAILISLLLVVAWWLAGKAGYL